MKKFLCATLLLVLLLPTAVATSRGGKASTTTKLSIAEQRKFTYFYARGLYAQHYGDYAKALEYYQHCFFINPKSAALHNSLANLYTSLNKTNMGYLEIAIADKLDPGNESYQRLLLPYHDYYGHLDKEIEVCKRLIKEHPNNSAYLARLSDCYEKQENWKEAFKQYQQIEIIEGIQYDTTIKKIQILQKQSNNKAIEKEIKSLANAHPEVSNYKLALANYYVEMNRLDEAENIYKNIIALSPTDEYAINQLGKFYYTTERKEQEDSLLWCAIRNDGLPISARVRFAYILDKDSTGAPLDSIFALLKMQHPDSPDFYECYAEYLSEHNDTVAAIDYAQRAINKESYRPSPWNILITYATDENRIRLTSDAFESTREGLFGLYYARLLLTNGQSEESYIISNQVLRDNPPRKGGRYGKEFYGDLYQIKGYAAYHMGLKEECFLAYDTCLLYTPEDPVVLNNYAYYLSLDTINLKHAEELVSLALEKEPTSEIYLGTYAWILNLRGDYISAKFYMEKAITYAASSPQFILYAQYGDILLNKGLVTEAVQAWQKAIECYKEGDEDSSESKESVLNKINQYQNANANDEVDF